MSRTDKLAAILLFALLAVFVAGVSDLFRLRLDGGDVYPPYSSLRADPLGARALFESVEQLPGLRAARSFRPPARVTGVEQSTLLRLGVSEEALSWRDDDFIRELDPLIRRGARLVVTFEPGHHTKKTTRRTAAGPMPALTNKLGEKIDWGLQLAHEALPKDGDRTLPVSVRRAADDSAWPAEMKWHSSLYFHALDDDWRTLYTRGTNAVVISRRLGLGEILLASDSWFASNEALRQDRQPAFLAALLGTRPTILFDETHLGTVEAPGVATLARQYRLHGLFLVLLLLAALFVWQSATSLVPRRAEAGTSGETVIAGRDSASGFTNLLRRTIPPAQILRVCIEEWRRSLGSARKEVLAKFPRAEAIAHEDAESSLLRRNPVQAYNEIVTTLHERKTKRP